MMSSMPRHHDRVSTAIALAAEAHEDQVYRGHGDFEDSPYVFHPIRVMLRASPRARVVAVLHDLLEDTDVPAPAWLLPEEREAMDLVTRRAAEEYFDFIDRIREAVGPAGRIAREVKRLDVSDHLRRQAPERLEQRYDEVLRRLAEREQEK